MKAHHVAGILFVVVLVGVGYALSVWTASTLPQEEAGSQGHATANDSTTSNATSAPSDHGAAMEPVAASGGPPAIEEAPVPAGAEPLPQGGLAMTVERTDFPAGPSVTFKLQAVGQDLNLAGWRLADALGASGHADHQFYFGAVALSAGQTLTLHSACGRDQGLTMYWCLAHPVTIKDSQPQDLYLYDGKGGSITCTPPAQVSPSMRYQCG